MKKSSRKQKNNWQTEPDLEYQWYLVNKFFNNLERRIGIVNGKAVMFCYNDKAPELSYILTEQL